MGTFIFLKILHPSKTLHNVCILVYSTALYHVFYSYSYNVWLISLLRMCFAYVISPLSYSSLIYEFFIRSGTQVTGSSYIFLCIFLLKSVWASSYLLKRQTGQPPSNRFSSSFCDEK